MKYIFAGNRFNVLDEMIALGLDIVKIFAIRNSYLEKELTAKGLAYVVIDDKLEFINEIMQIDFDIFISNGLPIILPIKILTDSNKKFINIHPSYLPDLRGADPIPGAILHQRDSGATCHYMNEGIDTGDIICQRKITYSPFYDSVILHQLCFEIERVVFRQAWKLEFKVLEKQTLNADIIYYSFKPDDLKISFNESPEQIMARIKAFNNRSKGAYFVHNGEILKVFDVELCDDEFIQSEISFSNLTNVIFLIGEKEFLFKRRNVLVKFKEVEGNISVLKKGDVLV